MASSRDASIVHRSTLTKRGRCRDQQMITLARTIGGRTKAGLRRLLNRVAANQRGSISIIAAASLPVVLGFGGLAVDASIWLRAKNAVQAAADAAASSAAAARVGTDSDARILAEARGVAAANGYQNGAKGVTVTLNHPPTSGSKAGQDYAYEVIITAPQQLYLANYFNVAFGLTAPTVQGRAVALIESKPLCVLSLDTKSSPAKVPILVSGSAVLTGNHCDIDANSPTSTAIETTGGGAVHTDNANVNAVGNYSGNVTATSGSVNTGTTAVVDPYATTRSIPTLPAYRPTSENTWSGNVTNPTPPGVKAYNGDVSIGANNTHLDPGIYIINGNFSASKSFNGTGVTIILTNGSSAIPPTSASTGHFSISSTVSLTAPTSGTTAGLVFWADTAPCVPIATCSASPPLDQFTGGSQMTIVGAVYSPYHQVKYTGSSVATSGCTQLVARYIEVTGTATFNHNCEGTGTLDPMGSKWSLVE
jgi:Flp pilus assembly protein TadG